MKKWNIIIDVERCFNCNMCALSCHDEYSGNEHPGVSAPMPKLGHRWIDIRTRERGQGPMIDVAYMSVMCGHCDNAPCIETATNDAVIKRPDGIVIIDPVKAKGQKQIVDSCPYGSVHWNEELQLPQAWPFDAHLLDRGWKHTRGTQTCPTYAFQTVHTTDKEMQERVRKEDLQVLHPEFGTKPRVYYKNLYRFQKELVGGSVEGAIDGVVECIAGARVVLEKGSETLGEQVTDTFGEFKFDGLDRDSGVYRLMIRDNRFAGKTVEFELKESVYLGAISL